MPRPRPDLLVAASIPVLLVAGVLPWQRDRMCTEGGCGTVLASAWGGSLAWTLVLLAGLATAGAWVLLLPVRGRAPIGLAALTVTIAVLAAAVVVVSADALVFGHAGVIPFSLPVTETFPVLSVHPGEGHALALVGLLLQAYAGWTTLRLRSAAGRPAAAPFASGPAPVGYPTGPHPGLAYSGPGAAPAYPGPGPAPTAPSFASGPLPDPRSAYGQNPAETAVHHPDPAPYGPGGGAYGPGGGAYGPDPAAYGPGGGAHGPDPMAYGSGGGAHGPDPMAPGPGAGAVPYEETAVFGQGPPAPRRHRRG
ncbi:MAG TPA: hypothetical protein VGP36_14140 [Mycobacteriales bacterium]|nr:hypothetical protein [Mycobacteriales bacterium]